ncbi:hypothetical protein [Agriterribacter sp.]|uniref:hypothetical protein n=1 Tax=Agriterribacter sp. TaxID=2821509 RepID=UPI002C5F3350|nr:hypothetical protein [Agriterribacter sp.]HRP58652.1 hypothetical protein [Agriterribacter sp.]
MGTAEIQNGQLVIRSNIITYGTAADPAVTENIREEIETMWNEPQATVIIKRNTLRIVFRISATCKPQLIPEEIFENTNPQNNHFRIEPFAAGNISFVDGLGCNSGYFKLDIFTRQAYCIKVNPILLSTSLYQSLPSYS